MKHLDVLRITNYLRFHLTEIREELSHTARGESDRIWGTKWGASAMVLKEHLMRSDEAITSALARIQNGTYGNCVACGNEIKEQRLEAVPWLKLCIVCQERGDSSKHRENLHSRS